jgi:hypothetical protein
MRPRLVSRHGQLVAGSFLGVANQQQLAVQGKTVPRLSSERVDPAKFHVLFGIGFHERQHPVLAQHHNQVADAEQLTVKIAAAAPADLAIFERHALKDAIGQAVRVFPNDRNVRELRLQDTGVFPY